MGNAQANERYFQEHLAEVEGEYKARIAALEAELANVKDMLEECRTYVAGGIFDYMNGPSERRECQDLVARIDAALNSQEPPNAK